MHIKHSGIHRAICVIFTAVLFAGLAGCWGVLVDRDIQLNLGPSLQTDNQSAGTIAVDLVGVNESDYQRWYNYSMTQYFSAGDLLRSDATKKTENFIPGSSATIVFAKDDPVWQQWQSEGDKYLFVLVQLPGIHQDLPGAQDPRRLILPLPKSSWSDSSNPIIIQIKDSGVVCETPPNS